MTAKRRRRRRWLFALVAMSISTAIVLAVVEVLLRVAWSPTGPMAEFQQKGLYCQLPDGSAGLTPGYRGTLQLTAAEPVTTIEIDGLGMRAEDPGRKQPGEKRLLVAGDSLVFGYGVEARETFCAVLQSKARVGGSVVTIGNGGVSGFNTFESARRIATLRPAFDPDAVLMCVYLGNDAIENRNQDVAIVGGLRFAGPFARLMQRSARARCMARSRLWLWTEGWLVENAPSWSLLSDLAAVHAAQDARGVPDASMPIANGCLFLDAVDEQSIWIDGAPPAVPRAIADFRAGLEQAVAAANGLPLHVLILPMWFHCTDAAHAELIALAKQPDASRFGRGLAQRRLIELCRELRLPVMDATAWLEAAGDTRSSWVSDKGHLSARGHRIVADNLARELASLWR